MSVCSLSIMVPVSISSNMLHHSQNCTFLSPDVLSQTGVIADLNREKGDSLIYSPLCGNAFMTPHRFNHIPQILGTFVLFNAKRVEHKWVITYAIRIEAPQGVIFVPFRLHRKGLQLRVYAVVHRMDMRTRSAWLWNDYIGRIHVPPAFFQDYLVSEGVVDIIAHYKGEHEDVPWCAVNIRPMEEGRDACEQRIAVTKRLVTSPGWKVTGVHIHKSDTMGYYTFLHHNSDELSDAFAAWTDYVKGEHPPPKGMECIVTYFNQMRYGKKVIRAVLVTPIHPIASPSSSPPLSLSPLSLSPLHHHYPPNLLSLSFPMVDTARRELFGTHSGGFVTSYPTYSHYGSCDTDVSTTRSMCSTESEMESMVDDSRCDDYFRLRTLSIESSCSISSSPPPIAFTPIFNEPDFEVWYPINE